MSQVPKFVGMEKQYHITGMSCSGCKTNVETALKNLPQVQKVIADINSNKVTVQTTSDVPVDILNQTLLAAGLHYTIEDPISQNGSGAVHTHIHNMMLT